MQTNDKSKRCVSVFDFENIEISFRKKYKRKLDLYKIDDWIHKNYKSVENFAFIDSKRNNGFRDEFHRLWWTVKDIRTKYFDNNKNSEVIVKNAIDNELILTAYDLASEIDILLLFAGDGDYLPLVKRLKRKGIEIHVVAVNGSLSECLKKFADKVIMINEIINYLQGVNN